MCELAAVHSVEVWVHVCVCVWAVFCLLKPLFYVQSHLLQKILGVSHGVALVGNYHPAKAVRFSVRATATVCSNTLL